MSLLLTSCTMGKQPDRLLNKGPQYLRTHTNASLFGQHRQSAVELLAASKAHFYQSKTSVPLDNHQDLAFTDGQQQRFSTNNNRISSNKKEPPRSRSQYDLTLSTFASLGYESDKNNNYTSNDSNSLTHDVDESPGRWKQKDNSRTNHAEGDKSSPVLNSFFTSGRASDNSFFTFRGKHQPKLTILHSASATTPTDDKHTIYENVTTVCMPQFVDGQVCSKIIKKPVPLPRKSKEKPIPSPRKLTRHCPTSENINISCFSVPSNSPLSAQSLSLSNKFKFPGSPQNKTFSPSPSADCESKHCVVDSLAKQFTTLSATSSSSVSDKQNSFSSSDNNQHIKTTSEISGTFTATPVFISKTDSHNVLTKQEFITDKYFTASYSAPKSQYNTQSTVYVSSATITINKNRKRCPDVSTSARAIKKERRSIVSETSNNKPSCNNSLVTQFVCPKRKISSSQLKSEMSVESADQAVCESEVNARAAMEGDISQSYDQWTREVTRSNSSLSGKMEHQDALPHSASPMPHTPVPRSHSDISCSLESRHSRDSSLVSNHSRLSRASIGTDLENFFNQMGLEKSVLEPINRLREIQAGDVFDNMSSFDSQETVSIYSHSEQECGESQLMDRSQQPTSVVERNARIIKWLCNVRKAKIQCHKLNSPATNKT